MKKRKKSFRLTKADKAAIAEQAALDLYYKRHKAALKGWHTRKQKVISKAIAREPVRTRYRVLQQGPILIERKGYYITIYALVPAEWATASQTVFQRDPQSEQWHEVIWRTVVRKSLKETIENYNQLLEDQNAYSEINDIPYEILSGELMVLHEDHSSYSIKVWEGTRIPRWVKATANRLERLAQKEDR